jgi:DNA-binding transcriptional ArsR family regulator
MEKIKAIFLAANPSITSRLWLDEEIRAITEKVRAADHRNAIEVISSWAVRPDDLLQSFNTYKPQIVHFSGHGNHAGEIILVNADKTPKPVSIQALKFLFTTLKDNIRLVILNACYSRPQAEAIADIIDCVIGMNDAIGDEAAILFAASFYRAICFGRSIQDAFNQGRAALLLEGITEDKIPELLTRKGIDPSSIILINLEDPIAHSSVDPASFSVSEPAPISQSETSIAKYIPLLSDEEAIVRARVFKALGEPVRLRILNLMSQNGKETCVFEVVENFTLEQSTISHHLRILRDAGLIDCRKRGLWAYYFIRQDKMKHIHELLNDLT